MPNSQTRCEREKLPPFLYGTAWKEDDTQRLVALALDAGFRGIDTANLRKHYCEAAVGQAVVAAVGSGRISRNDLFLQTKFTFLAGQDDRLPYDPRAPVAGQVQQSFASSLEHLGVDYIDSYVLHGPSQQAGLGAIDWQAWRAMEDIHDTGRARALGVSNVTLEQLDLLCRDCRVAPRFVQNRCYAAHGWDRQVRRFCSSREITYQGFSLLTANGWLAETAELNRIAGRHGRTPAQIVFRLARDLDMLPLTGTTSSDHMRQDLDLLGFNLEPEEIELLEKIGER